MPVLVVAAGPDEPSRLGFFPEGDSLVFGTGVRSDFVLSDPFLAREHFELLRRQGELLAQEIGGETRVQGRRAKMETALGPGAMIEAGSSLFVLSVREQVLEKGPLTGRGLGGYELLERVGSGGMGEVYRARQLELDRLVAIKILADELTSDADYIERFLREARAAGALNHPNVVEVHDVGAEEGVYYYSMEFVPGGTVLDLVRRKGRLCPVDALEVVTQAARALEFAEKLGIVHCDIKPDNLMLTETGQVRLADLGIAKRIGEDIPEDPDRGVFGSPYYMSPEQAKGYEVDNRTDIYSLGATFYRLLAGRPPFLGKEAREIMENHAFEEPPPLVEFDPTLPEALASIVEKMMRKERGERYGSAAELLRDLERAREHVRRRHEPRQPTRLGIVAAARKSAFSPLGAAVAACAFLAGILAGVAWPEGGGGAESPAGLLRRIKTLIAEGRLSEAETLIEEVSAASSDEVKKLKEAQAEVIRRRAERLDREELRTMLSSRKGGWELVRSLREFASTCRSPVVAAEAERLAAGARGEGEKWAEGAFRKAAARADVFACELDFDRARKTMDGFTRSAQGTLAAGRARLYLAELDRRMHVYRKESLEDGSALASAPATEIGAAPREGPEELIRRCFIMARLYMFEEALASLRSAQEHLRRDGGDGGDGGASLLETAVEELSRYRRLKGTLIDAIRRGALGDTSVELAGLKGRAVSATEEEVVLRPRAGKEKRIEWKALPAEAFAELFLSGKAPRRDFEVLARFCERSGLAKEARRALLRAHRRRKVRAAPEARAREEELAFIAELVRGELGRDGFDSARRLLAAAELRFGRAAASGLQRTIERAAARRAEENSALEELSRLRREVPARVGRKARASAERYAGLGEFVTSGDILLAAGEFARARARYEETAAKPGRMRAQALARLALAWALDAHHPSAPEHAREFARRAIEADPERARKPALGALRLAARRSALNSRLALLLKSREENVLDRARTEALVDFLHSTLPLGHLLRVELEFLRSRFGESSRVFDGTCDAYVLEHDWRLRDHEAVLRGLRRFRSRRGAAVPFGRQILLWEAESLFFAGERGKAARLYRAHAAEGEGEGEGEGEFARSGTLEKRLKACEEQ